METIINDSQLAKIIELLKQGKTLVLSYQASKDLLHVKDMTVTKINID